MIGAVWHESAYNATGNTRIVPTAGKPQPDKRVQAIFPAAGR